MDPFLPTSSRETPRRNPWRYVGGFVAGGALGVAVLLWFVGVIQPSYGGHYDALGLLVLAVFGSPVAGLVGGILGLVWAHRVGRTEDTGRAIRRSALIAVAAVAVLLIALPFLRQIVQWSSDAARHRRVQALVNQDFAAERDSWESTFGRRYPREQASLQPLLGPLLYPGSTLVEWTKADWELEVPHPVGWEITVSAPGGADEVLAYYMTVLPEGIDGYGIGNAPGPTGEWETVSAQQESADGRITRIRVQGDGDRVTIRFNTMSDTMDYSMARATPWPQLEDYREQVAAAQERYLEALHAEFGDWLYPDAELVFGDLQNFKNIAFDTPDPMDKVVDFYVALGKEPEWIGDKYRFWHTGAHARTPEVYVYPVHGGTRIYFRFMR